MMDQKVLSLYRSVYQDPGVDREEAQELYDFFSKVNPPPDKLPWLRVKAIQVACEYLDEQESLPLLRTCNYIVHAIEQVCMQPKEMENPVDLDPDSLANFYREQLTEGPDKDALAEYYASNQPSVGSLVAARATIFKVASECLGDDKDENIQILRKVNMMVHAFQECCLEPKPFELHEEIDLDMSISDAIQHLWDIDDNRLTPNEDYVINVGRGKKPYWKEDAASEPLFESVDPVALQRPTYRTFMALLDNYNAHTGSAEVVSSSERRETWDFLDAIMQTKPMQFCHRYCCHKDSSVPDDPQEFKRRLYKIWFELYRRDTSNDSSGFEHVFVGEVKDGDVSGFHNWLQFWLEEKKGDLDYRGYIKPKSSNSADTDSDDHLLSLQFSWHGVEKFVSSSFIGVSPEFEFALYTMCFLVGEEENYVELRTGSVENDTFGLTIKCYKIARGQYLGTSFPEVNSHFEE